MKKIILVITIVFCGILLSAFSVKTKVVEAELANVSRSFSKKKNAEWDIEYKMFKGYDSEVASNYEKAKFCKIDSNVYFKINNMETFITSKYQIQLVHTDRLIIISNPISNQLSFDPALFKEAIRFCEDISWIQTRDQKTQGLRFDLKSPNFEYDAMELHYDKNSYAFKKIIFFYPNLDHIWPEWVGHKARIEIDYFAKDKVSRSILNKSFRLDKYVIASADHELIPQKEYNDYKVIDLRVASNKK